MKTKILVAGDAIIDEWIEVEPKKLSPEAPIVIFEEIERTQTAGGVLNVLANLEEMSKITGIEVIYLDAGRTPSTKTRLFTKEPFRQLVRVDRDYDNIMKLDEADAIFSRLEQEMGKDTRIVSVLSDYNHGTLHPFVIEGIIENSQISIIDPKSNPENYKNCTFITPNEKELLDLVPNAENVDERIAKLIEITDANIIYKEGDNGAGLFTKLKRPVDPFWVDAYRNNSPVLDPTGAGDTLLATFAMSLAMENTVIDDFCAEMALLKAVMMSGIGVTYPGCFKPSEGHIRKVFNI